MNRFPGPAVMTGNYLRQVVPAGREIKLLVSSSSRARNCKKSIFPTKIHEHLRERNEISRRIQWKPPQAPEISQKSNFQNFGKTGSSNPFATVGSDSITISTLAKDAAALASRRSTFEESWRPLAATNNPTEIAKNQFFQRKFTNI